ncbi:hypothetical protein KHP57_15930 [Algiphilus sp. NNCM1]|nr:hypothetical protein [Algiphilus acroporae]
MDEAQFDAILASSPLPVLVDFWAPWCGPCVGCAPEVKTAAEKLGGAALVLKVNTETHPALASRYAVRSIPNFAVFRGGKLVRQQAGANCRGVAEARGERLDSECQGLGDGGADNQGATVREWAATISDEIPGQKSLTVRGVQAQRPARDQLLSSTMSEIRPKPFNQPTMSGSELVRGAGLAFSPRQFIGRGPTPLARPSVQHRAQLLRFALSTSDHQFSALPIDAAPSVGNVQAREPHQVSIDPHGSAAVNGDGRGFGCGELSRGSPVRALVQFAGLDPLRRLQRPQVTTRLGLPHITPLACEERMLGADDQARVSLAPNLQQRTHRAHRLRDLAPAQLVGQNLVAD